jgi:hypothetical protein
MHDLLPRAELRFLFSPAALLGLLFIGLLTAARIAMFAVPPLQWILQLFCKWTMFFRDPSGNSLEFKAMTNPDNLFAKYRVGK